MQRVRSPHRNGRGERRYCCWVVAVASCTTSVRWLAPASAFTVARCKADLLSLHRPFLRPLRRLGGSVQASPTLNAGGKAGIAVQEQKGTVALITVFVGLAVVHRVSHRVLLVPLHDHTQFLALVTAAVQLLTYSTLCWCQTRTGHVTPEMQRFVAENSGCVAAIGLFEGIFFPLVMLGAAQLPGAMVQVLNQALVPATVTFSAVLLGRRYNAGQLFGVGLVLAGVFAGSEPGQLAGGLGSLANDCLSASAAICIAAYCFLAMAVTLKEAVFVRWKEQALSGKAQQPLNTSLLCARAALPQFTLQFTLWIATASSTIHGRVHVLLEGIKAMLGFHEPCAPGLSLLYWACNIGFTFAALRLVRRGSAATVVLANVIALPLTALVFCWKLPLLPPQQFHWHFAFGLALVVVGNYVYGRAGLEACA